MTYTLTGRYPLGDLEGNEGRLRFTPSTTIVGDGNIVLPAPVEVVLDSAGSFSTPLVGTDDVAYAPSGWVWVVQELLPGGRAPWAFELTADSDIADLTAVATPADVEYNALASTSIIAGAGLTGGGTLAADRTLAVVYGTTAGTAAQGNDARFTRGRGVWLDTVTYPIVVAHRCGQWGAGEQTIESGEIALASGALGLELDARVTGDGAVIAMHDATIDRTTTGTGNVSSASLTQLAQVVRVDPNTPLSATAYGTFVVPTVEQFIDRFAGRVILMVEDQGLTPTQRTSASERWASLGGKHAVVIQSFQQSTCEAWAALGWQTMLLSTSDVADPTALYAAGVRWVGYEFTGTGTAGEVARITAAKAAGLKVATWVGQRRREVAAALAAGVDAPMTDRPSLALATPTNRSVSFLPGVWPGDGTLPGTYSGGTDVAVSTSGLLLSGGAGERNAMIGECGPITATTFTVTVVFRFASAPAGWFSIAVAGPDDREHKGTGAGGYHALLRATGVIDLYRSDGNSATKISTHAGAGALSSGVDYTLTLTVSPSQVTATVGANSASFADTTYRHAAWWPHVASTSTADGHYKSVAVS